MSLCDYIFPLFVTLVIGGSVSVISFVLLAGVLNIIDIRAFIVSAKKQIKFKREKKTA